MVKNYKKILTKKFTSLFFYFLFFLIAKNCSALEIPNYPTIAGQTITAATQLPDFALYLFNAGMFIGFFSVFVSIIMAGVMYLLSPIDIKGELRAGAKDRISGAISGLLILTLTYLIITTIYPQLAFFSTQPSTSAKINPPPKPPKPGVYFYKKTDCNSEAGVSQGYPQSIKDLGGFKNQARSANILHDTNGGNSYVAILYNATNFFGKCLYLDPNKKCDTPLDPFAASASIHIYSDRPNGNGVYFYRKPFFDKKGGYLFISNSEIENAGSDQLWEKDLNADLKFTGDGSGDCSVPKEEQDCIKYDDKGKCADDGRQCPTLGGENISSIKIDGDYLVLFFYQGPQDTDAGPWTSCQEFPIINDTNKTGPQQIKWREVRNRSEIPNRVLIIPIKK